MSSTESSTPAKLISQLLRDDPGLRDVVADFVRGLDTRLDEMRQAYQRLDWEQLATLAHRLKGAGGSYGYPEISRACAELEMRFRSHETGDFCASLDRLRALVDAARAGLE